jgi:uncharacterized protein YaiI (UPF0178 family)
MTIWADADSLPREVKNLIARRASSPQGGSPQGGSPQGGSPQGGSPQLMVTRAVFVANRPLTLPPGNNLIAVTVGPAGASKGPGPQIPAHGAADPSIQESADEYIMSAAKPGDILVTRDIPLAARALAAGMMAMNDRGALWTQGEIQERLSLRDHMAALRESGIAPPSSKGRNYGPKEAKAFADALDKAITKLRTGQQST